MLLHVVADNTHLSRALLHKLVHLNQCSRDVADKGGADRQTTERSNNTDGSLCGVPLLHLLSACWVELRQGPLEA